MHNIILICFYDIRWWRITRCYFMTYTYDIYVTLMTYTYDITMPWHIQWHIKTSYASMTYLMTYMSHDMSLDTSLWFSDMSWLHMSLNPPGYVIAPESLPMYQVQVQLPTWSDHGGQRTDQAHCCHRESLWIPHKSRQKTFLQAQNT